MRKDRSFWKNSTDEWNSFSVLKFGVYLRAMIGISSNSSLRGSDTSTFSKRNALSSSSFRSKE